MTNDSIGIDISKDHLDVHRLSDGAAARFANTTPGFRALAKWPDVERPALIGPRGWSMSRPGRTMLPSRGAFRASWRCAR